MCSSVNSRWWGETSAVTFTSPRCFHQRMVSMPSLLETCWMWMCAPAAWARRMSRSMMISSAQAGELGHLAMAGEEHAELGGVLHGAQQHGGIAGGVAIVGEHFHAERAHAVDAGHLLAVAVLGDAAGGVNRDAGGALG